LQTESDTTPAVKFSDVGEDNNFYSYIQEFAVYGFGYDAGYTGEFYYSGGLNRNDFYDALYRVFKVKLFLTHQSAM
jgi:hypothetical protein